MATIVLEYDGRNKTAGSLLQNLLTTGFFKTLAKTSSANYNKDFVKKILAADKEQKIEFTEELEQKYFGDL